MGECHGLSWGDEKHTDIWWVNLKEGDYLVGLGVNWRITAK
jgi:hypothetical protein